MILADEYGRRICDITVTDKGHQRITAHIHGKRPPAFLFKRHQRSPGVHFIYRLDGRPIRATIAFLQSTTIIFQIGDQS